MQESDFNSRFVDLVRDAGGAAYKIPDPPPAYARSADKRPFDGFGCFKGTSFYFESKFSKGYEAFAFSRVEEHQFDNLRTFRQAGGLSVILFAVWESRKYFDIYGFNSELVESLFEKGVKSFTKKVLLELKEQGYCTDILSSKSDSVQCVEHVFEKLIMTEAPLVNTSFKFAT
jgi:penicillin-binding protein-related factor A (putative recombinase)